MHKKRETISQFLDKLNNNWPELSQTMNPEIIKIHRLNEYLQQNLDTIIAQYQLQKADLSVISALRRSGEPYILTPTELAAAMLFSSGGLTKVLNRVTRMGLVERIDNPNDKRSKYVQLTTKGIELLETIMPQVQNQENFTNGLNSQQKITLNQLLDKMLSHWES